MDAPTRKEVENESKDFLYQLQFAGDAYKEGQVFRMHGVVFVPDPYTARK
jgi:hypothetical protein